jgi:hypothetical protein
MALFSRKYASLYKRRSIESPPANDEAPKAAERAVDPKAEVAKECD